MRTPTHELPRTLPPFCPGTARVLVLFATLALTAVRAGAQEPQARAAPPALQNCLNVFDRALLSDREIPVSFDDVAETTRQALTQLDDAESQLHAHYLLTLCMLIGGHTDGAGQSADTLADLAAKAGRPLPKETVAAIRRRAESDVGGALKLLRDTPGLPHEAAELARHLTRIAKARARIETRFRERKALAMQAVDRQITEWCQQEKLSPDAFNSVRAQLETLYDRQGHVSSAEISDALVRKSLEMLVQ